MKFIVQHLKYGSHFWISCFKHTLQKLVVITSGEAEELKQNNVLSGSHVM